METQRKSSMAGFEGKNFYLDLENSPQLKRQLITFITQLGGEIREFLDQRVKYIITARPKDQWPPKVTSAGRSRPSLPALDSLKDQTIQSPINLNKNSSFSRGSLLLSKCQQMVTKPKPSLPTDVLELARLWNITIMRAIDVLEFCRNHLSPVLKPDDSAVSATQVKLLKGPHIKLEDNRLQHRPSYKEFYEWPTINFEFEEYLCPFVRRKVQKESKCEEPKESLEGLAFKSKQNDKLNNNLNNNNNKTKLKTKSSPKNQTIKTHFNKKRRIPAFCEICGTDFDDLSEHLKTDLHESYTQNEDNYKELKGVIQSLLNPFVDTNCNPKRNHSVDASGSEAEESEEELSCSPFQSTPNMSTFQLCASKHKSHFLPIHDLIANKEVEELSDAATIVSEHRSPKTDIELVPPSITSPDNKYVKKVNQILNSGSNDWVDNQSGDQLNDSTEVDVLSEEL